MNKKKKKIDKKTLEKIKKAKYKSLNNNVIIQK